MSESPFFPATDSLKLLYAGNIGYAQDWEPLICLAEKTKGVSIEYFIIGEGVMKPVLEEKVRELELDNVHILPYQPRSLMPSILAYSDIQFIFMNPEMEMQDSLPRFIQSWHVVGLYWSARERIRLSSTSCRNMAVQN